MDFLNGKPLTTKTVIDNINEFKLNLDNHTCVKVIDGKIMFCGHISIIKEEIQFVNGKMQVINSEIGSKYPCTNESNVDLTDIGYLDNVEWPEHTCLSRVGKFKPYKYEWCGHSNECCDKQQKRHLNEQLAKFNERIAELKDQGHTCIRIIKRTSAVPQFNWCRKTVCGKCN